MTELRALTFDVGGVLYPDESFAAAAFAATNELRGEQGRGPCSWAEFSAVYDRVRAAQSGGLRRSLALELLQDADAVGELARRIAPRWVHPEGSAYQDVVPVLEKLRSHYRLAIIANQEQLVMRALRRDGLAEYFEVFGVSASVGFQKPDSRLFDWTLRELNVDPRSCAHVGNRLDTDVRPAHAMGMLAVWVLRGEAPEHPTAEQLAEADAAIRSLDELPASLAEIDEFGDRV
jgi:putative hydrolase of the HAD superfamily